VAFEMQAEYDDTRKDRTTSNLLQNDKDEKLTFRKPRSTPMVEPIEPSTTKGQQLREVITTDSAQEEEPKNIADEPMKMYFYYPKYLHPEAVALIAQNLLQEWENENK
jgi:hypothetical protein